MERANRDAEDARRAEIGGEREIFALDTLEGRLAPAHHIHLVSGLPEHAPGSLPRAADRQLLRFLTCGSVDDGKSTLIGRLLHDAGLLRDDELAALAADSARLGTTDGNLDVALLLDGLAAEREQAITIDVAWRQFATPRRRFMVADAPGHEQYTRNTATAASGADLAVLLVDAGKGLLAQTRRQGLIAALFGIRNVVIAVPLSRPAATRLGTLAPHSGERVGASKGSSRDEGRRRHQK
jgi:hypothetical protein